MSRTHASETGGASPPHIAAPCADADIPTTAPPVVRPGVRRLASAAILAGIAVAAALYYRRHPSDFRLIASVAPLAILYFLVLKLVGFLINGLLLKCLVAAGGVNLSFPQWFGLSRITQATNLILPMGGGSMKAVYLKRFHNLPYSAFLALMALLNLSKLFVAALTGIICLLFMGTPTGLLSLATGMVGLGALGAILLPRRFRFERFIRNRHTEPVWAVWTHWDRARSNGPLLVRLAVLLLASLAIASVEVWVSFFAFGLSIPFLSALAISAFGTMTAAFNLVPGNWGVREAIFAGISNLAGMGVSAGLHAALLSRAVAMVCVLATAPWFARSLTQNTNINTQPGGTS